jgi:hypothetical protein
MALDGTLDTALRGTAPLVVHLVKIALPGGTIRVLDGAGTLTFNAETYTGEDAVFGVLDGLETIGEQVGTEAPAMRLTFLPASLNALADLTNPANQGSAVSVWFGAVNPTTGLLLGTPEALFVGELDTADVEVSTNRTVISFNVASAWERLFAVNEGHRLNNAFIQSLYSGALGASFVIAVQRDLPWGYDAPRPAVVADLNGGSTVRGGSPVVGGGGGLGGGGGSIDGGFGVSF